MRYSQYLNRRRKMGGHVWQGRFYSTILDEAHVYTAVRYVENNPVRAGIVKKAEAYRWSSARGHVKGSSDGIVSKGCYLLEEISDWRRYLQEEEDGNLVNEIRKCSLTGRPCGDEAFNEMLEQRFSRRLKPLPQGRPRKGK
jgi:putative transposase